MTAAQEQQVIAALEAAVAGLECGAPEEEVERGFVACWNALHALGLRAKRVEPVLTGRGTER